MKKSIIFLLVLLTNYAFPCECMVTKLVDRFQNSAFIAKVKVNKVSKYNHENVYQKAEIEIIELYKGSKINTINIDNNLNSSCGLYVPENSLWLIFAQIDRNGNLSFSYCSGCIQIDRKPILIEKYPNAEKNRKNSIERKLTVLKYLSKQKVLETNKYDLYLTYSKLCLNELKGFDVKNEKFAIYEITIDKDLTISRIKSLHEFDSNQLSEKILQCMNENLKVDNRKIKEIETQTKVILIYYYYNAEGDDKSFISDFDL